MTTLVPDPIHLHRIDLDRNMRRFYEISVQPTLFGGASLVRTWGRIGTAGQALVETSDHPDETAVAFTRLERTKRRRGYRDATRAALP
ncbi:WGR domain-containing protein [Pinisolibacter sp.]|uniref:WGR domain-containing protein n=1 Tax=Pinisolibacter sp. TaxID=2172024 RepID=UPI002FDE7CF7